jgi:hypothetical protein
VGDVKAFGVPACWRMVPFGRNNEDAGPWLWNNPGTEGCCWGCPAPVSAARSAAWDGTTCAVGVGCSAAAAAANRGL